MRLFLAFLFSLSPFLLQAQAGANADSARNRPADAARGTPVGDPLLVDASGLSSLSVQARRMQDAFERHHAQGLRFYNGGANAFCEVDFGDFCYWNNNGDVPPPPERNDAILERHQLLEFLERAQAAEPSDDWVNGMRVRYAIEAERNAVAIEAANACRGTEWWCAALSGLALHVDNQHELAAAAFDKALASMPVEQRCTWTDMTTWLDTTMQPAYRERSCADKSTENALILRMAQPLWMMPVNDVRNELLARWTISRVHSHGRLPYSTPWTEAITRIQVRYGWPNAWSIQNGGVADPRPPSVTGHEPTPSYDFMPSPTALGAPLSATAEDWEPRRPKARMRYATRFATGFGLLPHQFARFRRDDGTVVAGAYRLVRDLEMGRAPYVAGLVLDSAPGRNPSPVVVRRDSAGANGALIAKLGDAPMLASLEVLAPTGKRAARVRTGVTPLAGDVSISDLLFLQHADPDASPTLEYAAANAYGSLTVDQGSTLGLFWEIYRPVSPAAPLQVTVRAERLNSSFFQRFGSSLGLSKTITPVSIRYADNGRSDGAAGRILSITFPREANGEYELTVTVSGEGRSESTSQIITIRGDDR